MAKVVDLGKVAGIIPEINSDGFWVIDGKVTGIRAQGPKGETGEPGQQGPKGDDGTNGRDGIVNVSVSGTTATITTNG